MTGSQPVPRLQARDVGRTFPGVIALDRVSMHVHPGEVLAVVGENGAGKSTLMKILAGLLQPDSGRILMDGEVVHLHSAHQAMQLGISLIHQELNLADNLDVGSNILLGREPSRLGFVNHARQRRLALEALSMLNLQIDPGRRVSTLSIGQQQLIEIARAISARTRVLIMDEPTSSLTTAESEVLEQVIDRLRRQGMAIIYISHRLEEVTRLADRVVVLRDGRLAGELSREQIGRDSIVRLMVGRQIQPAPSTSGEPGDVVLQARGLVTEAHPGSCIDLELRKGRVVGLAGLLGSGRTELLETIFGLRRPLAGSIMINGRPLMTCSPRHSMSRGIMLLPEDRAAQGLFLGESISSNISIANLQRLSRLGFLDRAAIQRLAEESIHRLSIRSTGPNQAVQVLSGGNQQKVVMARCLSRDPELLLLDEPSRGVDIGAKFEIHALTRRLAADGRAVLMASSEMEELCTVPDEVVVLCDGKIAGRLRKHQVNEQNIMTLATGGAFEAA